MNVYVSDVGGRMFLVCGDTISVPIDDIVLIDLHAKNGSAGDNSIRIDLGSTAESIYFAFENADAIRSFLATNQVDVRRIP